MKGEKNDEMGLNTTQTSLNTLSGGNKHHRIIHTLQEEL